MHTKKITNFMAGLLFAAIFCLNSGAFGSLPYDDAGLSSEKDAGYAQTPSEVVFIDPSVQDAEIIVSQLSQGAEVVRLSSGMDGIAQISAHLAEKENLSTIRIISHGNPGHFVLNGKRIDRDFLKHYGDRIAPWGRALAENGDILFYACNLAASYEGKAFVGKFANLTGADIAASTDITGGEIFNGNWNLEYSIGDIDTTVLTLHPDINVKLLGRTATWTGATNTTWALPENWDLNTAPVADDDSVVIPDATTTANDPDYSVGVTYAAFTIQASGVLNITGGSINSSGTFTNNGTVNAAGSVDISITATSDINLNGAITSATGAVTLDSGAEGIDLTGASTITSTSGTVWLKDIIDGGQTFTVNAGAGNITVDGVIGGTTAVTSLDLDGADIEVEGIGDADTVGVTGNTDINATDILIFDGTIYKANQMNFTAAAGNKFLMTSGAITTFTSSNDSITFNTGDILLANGSSLIINAGTGTVTALKIDGASSEDVSITGGTATIQAVGTQTLNGIKDLTINNTTDSTLGGNIAIKGTFTKEGSAVLQPTSKNITASGLSVTAGTFGAALSPSGTWGLSGNISVSSGATLNATSGTFTVGGNWTNAGTFNHKDGAVTLDGANQSISGPTTFYKLTKTVAAADTLTFQNGSANKTTVSNTMTLSGAAGQLLSLISSSDGNQWEIDPQSTRTIAYLDVKDSKNVNATAINAVGTNSVDSGNNTNWTFPATPTLATTTPTSYDCSVTKVEMHNGTSWVTIFSGTAPLDVVPGGTLFPGISNLSLPAGTYSQIKVTFTNSFPLKGSLSYGGAPYYTTATTFGGQTNLASTPTTDSGDEAEFTFRIEAWGPINDPVEKTFEITPITVDPSTDYQPTLRFTISDKLLLKGTAGTPSTYYFALSEPTVSIVEP